GAHATASIANASAGGLSIRAIAIDGAGNANDSEVGNLTIGGATPAPAPEAPITTLALDPSAPAASGWFTTIPTATLNATPENSTILVSLDGANETPYAAPFAISSGVHTLSYRAVVGGSPTEPAHEATIQVAARPAPPRTSRPRSRAATSTSRGRRRSTPEASRSRAITSTAARRRAARGASSPARPARPSTTRTRGPDPPTRTPSRPRTRWAK